MPNGLMCRDGVANSESSNISVYFCTRHTHLVAQSLLLHTLTAGDLLCFKEGEITGRSVWSWDTHMEFCHALEAPGQHQDGCHSISMPSLFPACQNQACISASLWCQPRCALDPCLATTWRKGCELKPGTERHWISVSCRGHHVSVCVCCSEYFTLDNKLRGLHVPKPKLTALTVELFINHSAAASSQTLTAADGLHGAYCKPFAALLLPSNPARVGMFLFVSNQNKSLHCPSSMLALEADIQLLLCSLKLMKDFLSAAFLPWEASHLSSPVASTLPSALESAQTPHLGLESPLSL